MTVYLEKKIEEQEPLAGLEWAYDIMSLCAINRNSDKLPELEKQLVKVLSDCASAYYNKGTSPISDQHYDLIEKALRLVNPNNPHLKKVGANV